MMFRFLKHVAVLFALISALSIYGRGADGTGNLDISHGGVGYVLTPIPEETATHFEIRNSPFSRTACLLPNGRVILVSTRYLKSNPSIKSTLVRRYTTAGATDASFGQKGVTTVSGPEAWGLNVSPSGKILVAGTQFKDGSNQVSILRLTANGNPEAGFGSGGVALVDPFPAAPDSGRSAALTADGGTLVGAISSELPGGGWASIQKFSKTGVFNPNFRNLGAVGRGVELPGISGKVVALAEQTDRKVLALAEKISPASFTVIGYSLSRLLSTGELDHDFAGSSTTHVTGGNLVLQPDGAILVGGGNILERLLPNGQRDPDFGADGSVTLGIEMPETGSAITLQADGKILVAGFVTEDDSEDSAVERYLPDGTLDTTFGEGGRTVIQAGTGNDRAVQVREDIESGSFWVLGTAAGFTHFYTAKLFGAGKPVLQNSRAENLTDTTATLSATVNPKGSLATVTAEYGLTRQYGSTLPGILPEPAGRTNQDVSIPVSGLLPDKLYYYRLTVANGLASVSATGSFRTRKTLVIESPAQGAVIKNGQLGGTVTMTASVHHGGGVSKVEASVNGGPWIEGVLELSAAGNAYSFQLPVAGGANQVVIRVLNLEGDIAHTSTHSFTYVIKSALAVQVQGEGRVLGLLRGAAYQVGKTYKLKAKSAPGHIFSHWAAPGLPATAGPNLTFVFTEALAAAPVIDLHFVSSIYLDAEQRGTRIGLISPDVVQDITAPRLGRIEVTTTSSGAFSGSVRLGGKRLPIRGVFDAGRVARFQSDWKTAATLKAAGGRLLDLRMHWQTTVQGQNELAGTLAASSSDPPEIESSFTAFPVSFDGKTPGTSPPGVYLEQGGKFTLVLRPAPLSPPGPLGFSHGLMTLRAKGSVTFTLSLADSTTATGSDRLTDDLAGHLYIPLYTQRSGCLWTRFQLQDQPDSDLTDDPAGQGCWWVKPAGNRQHYPQGWPAGFQLELLGAKFNPASRPLLPGLAPESPNAVLAFTEGDLATSLDIPVTFDPNNVIRPESAAAGQATVKITSSKGRVTGKFTAPNTLLRHSYSGVILQKGAHQGAFGYFLTPAKRPFDGAGKSGVFSLAPN